MIEPWRKTPSINGAGCRGAARNGGLSRMSQGTPRRVDGGSPGRRAHNSGICCVPGWQAGHPRMGRGEPEGRAGHGEAGSLWVHGVEPADRIVQDSKGWPRSPLFLLYFWGIAPALMAKTVFDSHFLYVYAQAGLASFSFFARLRIRILLLCPQFLFGLFPPNSPAVRVRHSP